jgi:3-deoxy-D-manno-octulosonate 8-phosphate phosphatase KdsC-like HAD superfamily phosphatase
LLSVDLVILDFDGVLTDNRVYVFRDGREGVVRELADVILGDELTRQ